MALLGIDIGSTALKAALFEADGRQLAAVRLAYRREPDAWDWWRLAAAAVSRLLRERDAPVEAVGLAGQGGTRVLLDGRGRPIGPPAGFSPGTTALRQLTEAAGRGGGHGLRLAAYLASLREGAPDAFARVHAACFAKDYVLFRLTGSLMTDPASGPDAEGWPAASIDTVGPVRLPDVGWPWTLAGRITAAAARATGLPAGTPVAIGAHDGAAATVGAGAAEAGRHSVTLGTNTVYRIVAGECPAPSRFWQVLPGLWAYGGDVTRGGYAVDWLLGLARRRRDELEAAARALRPGAGGVVFLPQMAGRVLPAPRVTGAAAAFTGLSAGTGPEHLYRAVLEGNAFALRAVREALLGQGLPDGRVYVNGGGARSALWVSILTDALGEPVRWSGVEDACRGAAVFGGVAAGVWPDIDAAMAAACAAPHESHPSAVAATYDDLYRRILRVRDVLDGC